MVERLLAKEKVASSNLVFRSIRVHPVVARAGFFLLVGPKWRNRQTRQSQKLMGGNSRVGSSPTFGIMDGDIGEGREPWLF